MCNMAKGMKNNNYYPSSNDFLQYTNHKDETKWKESFVISAYIAHHPWEPQLVNLLNNEVNTMQKNYLIFVSATLQEMKNEPSTSNKYQSGKIFLGSLSQTEDTAKQEHLTFQNDTPLNHTELNGGTSHNFACKSETCTTRTCQVHH